MKGEGHKRGYEGGDDDTTSKTHNLQALEQPSSSHPIPPFPWEDLLQPVDDMVATTSQVKYDVPWVSLCTITEWSQDVEAHKKEMAQSLEWASNEHDHLPW